MENLNGVGLSHSIQRDTDFEILRAAADLMWPSAGGWVYDSWRLLNDRIFDGRLVLSGIVFGLLPYGKRLGYYSPKYNIITLHESILGSRFNAWGIGFKLGQAYALDVLLHEMCHQAGYDSGRRTLPKEDHHHCHAWTDMVNSISHRAGLGNYFLPVYKRTKSSKKDGKSRKNIWVPSEPDVVSDAQARGLEIVPREAISRWPHNTRASGYYEARRKAATESLIQEWQPVSLSLARQEVG